MGNCNEEIKQSQDLKGKGDREISMNLFTGSPREGRLRVNEGKKLIIKRNKKNL